jgi:hypothetical protein
MLAGRLNELMGKPFSEIRALPKSSTADAKDDQGHRIQVVTWCDQLSPTMYRVIVSSHRSHGLGISSVLEADGFTIDEGGNVARIDEAEARALLR